MKQTINIVLFLVLFLGIGGAMVAMPHKDYEGCDGNCEQRTEAASLNCLAQTIYYEAGNQPTKGKSAVAFVILNRVQKDHSTICGVVQKPGQFFWVSARALRRKPKNPKQWAECQQLALDFLENPDAYSDPTHGAVAFRRPIDVAFPKTWVMTARIGGHIFYSVP